LIIVPFCWRQEVQRVRSKRAILLFFSCFALLTIIWGSLRALEQRREQIQLQAAVGEMKEGRYAKAWSRLSDLLARRPAWAEATYQLGVCEQARQRPEDALQAFARVPRDSEWAGWSDVRSSRLEMDRGQFARCESLLRRAAGIPGTHVAEARWGLVLLMRMEGRFDEARRWLQAGFGQMSSPVVTLQRLYKLDVDPFPVEGVRWALERAGKQAPDDDRVWLARAHLAMRLGDFAGAARWLAGCLIRRPDDPVVWRMKLELAQASDQLEEVRTALPHLPTQLEPENRVASLRAWIAKRQGNIEAERTALRELIALNPADARALDRLASLEAEAGRAGEAAKIRSSIRTIDQDRKEYIALLASESPPSHASELARLASRLGRRFDSARWAELGDPAAARGLAGMQPKNSASRLPDLAQLERKDATPLADALPEIWKQSSSSTNGATDRAEPRAVLPRFSDDAQKAGLVFIQENGGASGKLIPPVTASGGVALIDFNNDGWLDVYCVQGGRFPPGASSVRSGDRLFKNRADGTFEDVSESSQIATMPGGYGHGVAVGDYNNDGHADLFITRWRSYALYRNRGDGTFEDATHKAGLAGDRDWPTSAAFADLDGDGDLDLYVCHYFKWDEHDSRKCADPKDPTIYRCLPVDFEALPDHVFRNDGGRFTDVTKEAGITDADGRGLGVLAADLDGDGRTDLFVANDMSANYLFHNLGGFRFEEIGHEAGVAGNASGTYQAGMGVACGDLDRDGRLDLAVTNFYNESTTFYRNLGQGLFADLTSAVGLAVPSRYLLGFGIAFFDANNDGLLDLITANGHVHDGRPQFPWQMPVQLFLGDSRGKLTDVSNKSGPPFEVPRMGRGLAVGDLDNDGRVDVLVVSQNEPLAYLHNQTEGGHFVTPQLEGTTSNRDAVGAVVSLKSGSHVQTAPRLGGGSYQSASDPRIQFGLGTSRQIDWAEVRWPSGRRERFDHLEADHAYLLREGSSVARPLSGWKRTRTGAMREETGK
jgi:tetratricopeptide (TPR) repeat protein